MTIRNGTIDGTSTGVRIGEPGKNNAGPTNVVVENVIVTNATVGGFENASQATVEFPNYTVLGGGDDSVLGEAGNHTIDGGAGTDIITYDEDLGPDDFSYNAATNIWTVTTSDGVDQLIHFEKVVANGKTFLLVDNQGSYTTIQSAVDAASDGNFILVAAGTYTENVNFNKAVTVLGAKYGVDGGARDESVAAGEANVVGRHQITATTGAVTLDGLRFVNNSTASGNVLQIGNGAGHTVENSVFWSSVSGAAGDVRAIFAGPIASGSITIDDNAFSGAQASAFGSASWGRLIWSDGGGVDLTITGNSFQYGRTGLNLDLAGSSEATVSGNSFDTVGTGISVGITADNLTVTDNDFVNVDTDFNLRNLTDSSVFDADVAIDELTGGAPVKILGGAGADTLSGTEGSDYIDGNNHPSQGANTDADILSGRGGSDALYGRGGDDQLEGGAGDDTIDGGAGTDTAVFSGDWKDYAISVASGVYTVTDSVVGRDGQDTLAGIEVISFNGDTFSVADIVNVGPAAADDSASIGEDAVAPATGDLLDNDADANVDAGLGDILSVINARAGVEESGDAFTSVGTSVVIEGQYGDLTVNANGTYSYALDNALVQSLGAGQTATDTFTFTYEVSDSLGLTDKAELAITVVGANDAPEITSSAAAAQVTVKDGKDLNFITGADEAGNNKLEPLNNYDVQIASLLSANPNDMPAVLSAVTALLPAGSGAAEAIATVWDYIDDNYSYYNNAINEASARLGVEYALYLKAGGAPLTGTAAKFTPDGGDAGSAPDRVQSLHDNLLGNVHGGSLQDKLLGAGSGGSNPSPSPSTYAEIIQLLADKGLSDLVNRPIFSGNETASVLPSLAFDETHGLLPPSGGQLTATDVDAGDTLTWSGNAEGVYGSFKIDPVTGKWTYVLNTLDADTQGLADGETDTETFTATVTDSQGATDTQTITVTVTGANDAPTGSATAVLSNGTEDVAYIVSTASLTTGFSDIDGDALSVANLTANHGSVANNGDGTYTVTPTADYVGAVVLTYQVVDGKGGVIGASQSFTLANGNDAPTDITLTGGSVAENSANNTVVGSAAAVDPDAGNSHTYSLVDNAGGRFAINSATGEIRVANGALLNYEAATSHNITVKAVDQGGLEYQKVLTIQLTDAAETQTYNGTTGPDVFTAPSDDNWVINALAGADTITTKNGSDVVRGAAGDDVINTGGGDDIVTFSGSEGFDAVDGGEGNDRINALANGTAIGLKSVTGIETISANGYANVSILGSTLGDTLNFSGVYLENISKIDGGGGNDVITGSVNADSIIGGAGNDTLAGDGGDDTFTVGASAGVDSFDGGAGANDRILASANNVAIGISALTGVEEISANGFTGVSIVLTTGDDVVDFTDVTLTGITKINGGTGADQITGSAGADYIIGGAGDDTLLGGDGDDTFELASGYGLDTIDGGAGSNDRIVASSGLSITWKNITGIEAVSGASLKILGTAVGETLDFTGITLTGVSKIYAGGGNDTVIGTAGADTLEFSAGQDTLTGGLGADIFDLDALSESVVGAADLITDFEQGVDKISLTQVDASTKKSGDQAFTFINTGAFTNVAGQLRVTHADASSTSIFGDVNGDGVADFQINLATYVVLNATDFSL